MKKVLCCMMAVIMAVMCLVPAFAGANTPQNSSVGTAETDCPVVVVRGMDFTGLTYDRGLETQENAVKGISFTEIAGMILKSLWAGITSLNFDAAVDGIIDYVSDIMGKLACDKDGNSLYNVSSVSYPLAVSNYPELTAEDRPANEAGMVKTLAERYGGENVYFYVYDWRLNPLDSVDALNDMIELALREHPNSSKVNIICASMGGIQTVAYMTKYGYSKLNKVMFMSSAFCGAYVPTDLFQGKVSITSDTLYDFCKHYSSSNIALSMLVKVAKYTGVFKLAELLAKLFVDKYKDKVYDEFLIDTFGTMPGFWSLVLEDEYDACMEYMFNGRQDEYSGIIAIADELHQMVLGRDEMLKAAQNDGVSIVVVANYNTPLAPVYERSCTNGDGTLETAPMSGFATVANYGETLDVTDGEYISPDHVIDASTALFRDSTWLVKDAQHVACSYGTDYADFMLWLLEFSGQPTVNSNADYPQFLRSNGNLGISTWE